VNPWAGCSPGWDCPWFPDTSAGHCKSEMHQTETYEIYRTASECCEAHFAGSSSCLADSKASHVPFPWPIYQVRPNVPPGYPSGAKYFPDLSNKLNCVHGRNYEEWMLTEGYDAYYLFDDAQDCCDMWYPQRTDCPDPERAVTPDTEQEAWFSNPYPMNNYYFPDFDVSSCGFGRDYPAWMGDNGYEKWYLFTDGDACCSKYFPHATDCPYENTVQTGYYWESYQARQPNDAVLPIIYNHSYYPDLNANTCINGTDYPSWMISDDVYKRLYIFHEPEDCCAFWFGPSDTSACVGSLVQSVYIETNATILATVNQTEELLGMWYPNLDDKLCQRDGEMPSWMLQDGFTQWYLFNTREACCGAFQLQNC
jgi:hypothetical protein